MIISFINTVSLSISWPHRKPPSIKQRYFATTHFYTIYQLPSICKEFVKLSEVFVDLSMVIHEQGVVRDKKS